MSSNEWYPPVPVLGQYEPGEPSVFRQDGGSEPSEPTPEDLQAWDPPPPPLLAHVDPEDYE